MSLDTVLKIGGSLDRSSGLTGLCSELGRLRKKHSMLVVPGGGRYADQVRESYRKYDLGETAAHCMALLAMDQYGYLLNGLIEGSCLETDPEAARLAAESGRVAILLPSVSVLRDDSLPHSWDVTSDSIAAWVAGKTGCQRLILLKDVDGLMPSDNSSPGFIEQMTVAQLEKHSGGVDNYLFRVLSSTQLETWVINGLKPERIEELLTSCTTTGTRIRPF